jgi:hypothetical protein
LLPYKDQDQIGRKTFTADKSSNLAMVVSPLAGIAFVAAAAVVAISPVYLTLTSSILSCRKKRDLSSMIDPSMADKITEKEIEIRIYTKMFLQAKCS